MGVPFTLEVRDITIPSFCPVLELPLKPSEGDVTGRENSPSLDRIDPRKGYIVGNVAVISYRANVLKGDSSLDELKLMGKFLKENQ